MPALPSLALWTKTHLVALLRSTTSPGFSDAFNSFFAPEINITFNGQQLSREQYMAQINEFGVDSIQIDDEIEVEKGIEGQLSGRVGLSYTATISETGSVASSLNIIIGSTQHTPSPGPFGRYSDSRRVIVLNQVLARYNRYDDNASVPGRGAASSNGRHPKHLPFKEDGVRLGSVLQSPGPKGRVRAPAMGVSGKLRGTSLARLRQE
ncbi:hypothetical protein BJ138DRAFT_1112020 [Hygrophoropsis aurantiaca]|uniref:Uncharacterized protein n=1 Tax=Hygrophoropsis aurantiaca TaxID=72124 RepID=A0ACB8AGZ7_9AGAM|nr:hypothetical protein BJ138DRAFT_1112020 [Hygrophoropsis aurantiaca]